MLILFKDLRLTRWVSTLIRSARRHDFPRFSQNVIAEGRRKTQHSRKKLIWMTKTNYSSDHSSHLSFLPIHAAIPSSLGKSSLYFRPFRFRFRSFDQVHRMIISRRVAIPLRVASVYNILSGKERRERKRKRENFFRKGGENLLFSGDAGRCCQPIAAVPHKQTAHRSQR